MSKDKHTYRTISEEEIISYLKGEVVGKRANEIERYLLDNPFDQEAVEGYEKHPHIDISDDLDDLRKRLNKKPASNHLLFRIAASVALLIAASAMVWFYLDYEEEDSIAMNEHKEEIKQSPSVSEPEIDESPTVPMKVPESREPDTEDILTIEDETPSQDVFLEIEADIEEPVEIEELPNEPVQNQLMASEPPPVKSFDMVEMEEENDIEMMQAEPVADQPQVMIRGTSSKTMARSNAIVSVEEGVVTGQVTDETGEPLPGVTVVQKGSSNGVVTDIDGNYSIESPPDATLQFSFVGMETTETPVEGRNEINTELESDEMSLSEVVVMGYGVAERQTELGFSAAFPIGGNADFKEYLQENLVYPEEAKENEIEGRVVLKLTISAIGSVEEVEVRKSLGYGCDEEAIRLIVVGPDWEPATRDGEPIESTVRVRVKFELE